MRGKKILRYTIIKAASNGDLPCPAVKLDCSTCWLQVIRTNIKMNNQKII
jgi:hypothetical protein